MKTSHASERLAKLTGEFLVIAVSVFIALAAETWWSGREDRRHERELREDIREEFRANMYILESDLAVNDTSHARLLSFVRLGESELQGLSSEFLTANTAYPPWAGFDPEMGSTQALVESGNVGAIRERQLRLLLSRWAGLLEEKRRFNLQAVDFQSHRLLPFNARAMADGSWTAAERREVQMLMRTFVELQGLVIKNQERLRSAAQSILDYLEN